MATDRDVAFAVTDDLVSYLAARLGASDADVLNRLGDCLLQTSASNGFEIDAPSCEHCGCRILGHGVEAGGEIFCCAHCVKAKGNADPVDRVTERTT